MTTYTVYVTGTIHKEYEIEADNVQQAQDTADALFYNDFENAELDTMWVDA